MNTTKRASHIIVRDIVQKLGGTVRLARLLDIDKRMIDKRIGVAGISGPDMLDERFIALLEIAARSRDITVQNLVDEYFGRLSPFAQQIAVFLLRQPRPRRDKHIVGR